MGLSGKTLQTAQLLLVVLPAFVLFGYNQSGVGGLLSLRDWNDHFPAINTIDFKGAVKANHSTKQGAVVATFTIGALFGALSCSWIGDILGRRKLIFGAAFLTLVGEILQCTSFQLVQFIIGRFVLGWGVGALSATVPVWQSECSSSANRGKHVVLDGCFISLGYLLEAWINLGFFEQKNLPLQWRIPLAIPTVISLVPMICVFLIPESPRWLVNKGRVEEARASLSSFKGLDIADPEVSAEISGIEFALEETGRSAAKMSDIFTMGKDKLFYRFSLCIFLQFLQQMCGSNLISTYSTIIFQQGLGLNSETSRILSGGALTWKFLSCFVAFFTIDRFGRRKLFMFSGAGMASCMLALAIASSFPKSNSSAQIASALFVFLFNFFIPIGFLGANFLYCTEVAPTRLRVPMSGISTANHWLWNFVVNMVTPVAIDTIGWQYYLVFLCISALILPVVFLFYPETMGRSLEELEVMFTEGKSITAIVRMSRQPFTSEGFTTHMIEKHSKEVDEEEYLR
ncbi:Sugar transporter STL1 [Pyrenophora tritici-repentis]|uniref:ProP, Permease major facilitator superfamily n=1 Tax=Pyrenophora tritici-repentis TaxID=45151 RepID=A0A2W1HXA0_9PLEO|nr:Sugar transporter STL1 [Pyrenophora tritici-repentis]KAF7447228.1 Sugar transporter STL1 [Pyrenophora tritici-repentis]KAF7569585.1 ProP, Permease major facilitator superfamily [Pyrenophora tritici-repentis]KAI0573055.1 Sugar transporter STL1 [Pyrenophora tritici-repentis]KAI0576121.1 Sugar transporter STL1 [Pyrenophora tritici-repentis]